MHFQPEAVAQTIDGHVSDDVATLITAHAGHALVTSLIPRDCGVPVRVSETLPTPAVKPTGKVNKTTHRSSQTDGKHKD